ncbi:MAG: hypothetical protein ACO36I_10670 [Candidatus Latescibacterota bacterium]|jgi:hypothetical protein
MKDFRPYIHRTLTFIKRPQVIVTCGLLSGVFFLILALAILDYQTNFISIRLGKLLMASNPLRPQVGNIWQRIEAQARTQETIDKNETLSLNDIQKGLPDPIRQNRFESEQIPDTGIPGYVSIWKTPLPNTNINDRSLNDIITSRRIYQRGLAVIEALTLPDVHFHSQVRARLEQLYAQFDDLNAVATDTLIIANGDTLDALAPEDLKAAVFDELATEMIPTLKEKERKAFLKNYQEGHTIQLFLYRDLGRYRGELYHDHAPETPIPFAISTAAVANIFQFEPPDSIQIAP